MSMALAALGIDLMLPAFGAIRADLGLAPDSNAVTGLVTAYFLGLALGQLVYGPVADRFGRRPTLFVGYAVYAVGALAAAALPTLGGIMAARFVWGLGAAGPRVVTLAVVRDRWEGERMSRAMSFIMAVFILVPIVAPTIGATVAAVASWRLLFAACVFAAALMTVWAALRLPETLAPEHRRELRFTRIVAGARQVATHRQTAAYTLALTALYGVFTSYLGSSEVIYAEVFDASGLFPYLFGGLAAVMGGAMLVNARVVDRVGTRRFAHAVLCGYLVAATLLVGLALATGGRPPLWMFMGGMALMLASHALLIPNFNTIAMDPMGAIAGTASSVIGALQLAVGALLGALLDRMFDGTILPLALGFLGYGLVAMSLVLWAEGGQLFRPLRPAPDEPDGTDRGRAAVPVGTRA
jgi:DHA1 family bicyclomycin/chloramphenicol resistance-like MFS transporter